MLKTLIYIFWSCLLLQAAPVFSQATTGDLNVRIFSAGGDSLAHYQINILSSTQTIKLNASTSHYRITALNPDFYTIVIYKKGFHSSEMTSVPVKAGRVTFIEFRLRKRKCGQRKQLDRVEYKEIKISK